MPRATEADLVPEPDKSFDWDLVRAASLCKVHASESALTVVQEAFELWAATGYMKKNPIEKLLRDALSFIHSDGTNDVLTLKAARMLGDIGPDDPRYSKRVEEAAAGR